MPNIVFILMMEEPKLSEALLNQSEEASVEMIGFRTILTDFGGICWPTFAMALEWEKRQELFFFLIGHFHFICTHFTHFDTAKHSMSNA